MLARDITYTDYDGNERTETFFFNLSQAELVEMEMGVNGGMNKMLERVVKNGDTKHIIEVFKDIILRSYGEKSPDGKHFIKRDKDGPLCDRFEQSAAFPVLFMELATDDKKATAFVNGIIPQSVAAEIANRA